MPKRAAISVALLTAVATVTGGCSAYRSPRFEVVSVEEIERTDEAVVLNFALLTENRNDEPLPLRRAHYRLSLDGVEVFEGARSAEAVVRRYGEQIIELPAVVPAGAFDLSRFDGTGELDYRLSGSVEYITPGELAEVLFDTGLRRTTASLNVDGVIDLGG